MKGKWTSPSAIIGVVVTLFIATALIINLYPMIVSNVTGLASLGNFTFGSMFSAENGIVVIILSAGVLLGVLALIGVNLGKGSKR